jgi:probable HAF family extracellular repeat protein
MAQDDRRGIPVRITLLSAAMALGMLACTSVETPTDPSGGPSLTRATAGTYTAVDLGTLGGRSATARGINPAGQIVGESYTEGGAGLFHAFLWEKGLMTDLGTLPGGDFSGARGIDPAGRVVGFSYAGPLAVVWDDGVLTELSPEAAFPSVANAINPSGQIVGSFQSGLREHAFLWDKGVLTDLSALGGDLVTSLATAINPAGQVVGSSNTLNGERHAVLWSKGVITDLGTLGGERSDATGINPAGLVVGSSLTANGEIHAFLWSRGVMTDLGTHGGPLSAATGVNPAGQVVGYTGPDVPPGERPVGQHAFVWEKGVMTDLGTLGGDYSQAFGINPAGDIVGTSVTAGGEVHATLWTRN